MIHGAVLTAWSAAAVAGPVIITELPLGVLAGLLAAGLILTLMVRPLKTAV